MKHPAHRLSPLFILFLLPALLASCSGGTPKAPKEVRAMRSGAQGRVILLRESEEPQTDTVKLGMMRSGEVIRQDFTLRNGTPGGIVILSVTTTCGCTAVEFPKRPIAVDGEAPFRFEFDSRGFTGYQLKLITIRTSNPKVTRSLIVTADVI